MFLRITQLKALGTWHSTVSIRQCPYQFWDCNCNEGSNSYAYHRMCFSDQDQGVGRRFRVALAGTSQDIDK
jgi:hypothetical protein